MPIEQQLVEDGISFRTLDDSKYGLETTSSKQAGGYQESTRLQSKSRQLLLKSHLEGVGSIQKHILLPLLLIFCSRIVS